MSPEKIKYTCGDGMPEDTDPLIEHLLEKFSVVRPLCELCRQKGLERRHGVKNSSKKIKVSV